MRARRGAGGQDTAGDRLRLLHDRPGHLPGARRPGIARVAEPDSVVLANMAAGSIPQGYNAIIEAAAEVEDLEALVLVHQDAEIVDADLCAKVRRVLSDDAVGVVGALGVVGARSIAWWEGTVTWSSVTLRYGQSGGGDLPAWEWARDGVAGEPRTGVVDMVVGWIMVLSPWVVRNVRFDEALGGRHGYDFDLCLQVRMAGRTVVAEDLRLVHHHSLDLVTKNEPWLAAHARVAEKWEGRIPGHGDDGDWRARARRAEAEAGAARLLVASRQFTSEAAGKARERRLTQISESASWRLTEPLRRANEIARARRGAG
jgi:hypothetical protein